MKKAKPFYCQGYSWGTCPFDFAGGICPDCPESFLAFLVTRFLICIKKLIGRINNRQDKNTPCFECIKRGGICRPECEKRTRREKA
jgi:hypothetical protein